MKEVYRQVNSHSFPESGREQAEISASAGMSRVLPSLRHAQDPKLLGVELWWDRRQKLVQTSSTVQGVL